MAEPATDDLHARLAALTDDQVGAVLAALVRQLARQARDAHAADAETAAALAALAMPGAAEPPTLPAGIAPLPARDLLFALADDPAFHAEVSQALEHGQFVAFTGLEPVLIGAAIIFVLSLNVSVTARKRPDGRTEWSVSIGKKPTGEGLIARLLGLGAGGGATGADTQPGS